MGGTLILDKSPDFFKEKKPWSRYKDLILDYYLKPYLFKVAQLKKPIVVVDCFAGPGLFGDGELGSPLIISKHLEGLHKQNIDVKGFYIEKIPFLYEQLEENTKNSAVPVITRQGRFKEYINEIFELSKKSTVFIYLDPIKPSQLLFNDMQLVYEQIKQGQSVEVLINFLSPSFLRAVLGLRNRIFKNDEVLEDHPRTLFWNQVAGGSYWHKIAFKDSISAGKQTDLVTNGYCNQLSKWFDWTLSYPIKEKYEHEMPKYHLIFGSRYPDAVDLMNRAMVKARREFVGARFIKNMLFDNQPKKEVIDPDEIKEAILATSQKIGKTTWKLLRVNTTVSNPCMYTDSEFNKAIKNLIKDSSLKSDCSGKKIEENAYVWVP